MKFDLISDVHMEHLDEKETVEEFVFSLLPKHPSDILVFAGDFGYSNQQAYLFLKTLKNIYRHILFVYGNNELKARPFRGEVYKDVKERVVSFQKMVGELEGVHHLDGKTISLNGMVFGGSNIFYDFGYWTEVRGKSLSEVKDAWEKNGLSAKHKGYIMDPFAYAEEEMGKVRKIVAVSDVIITHAPPHFFQKEEDVEIGFNCFNGEEFRGEIDGKIWCFGHKHERMIDNVYEGCRFFNASFDNERNGKIITISREKT